MAAALSEEQRAELIKKGFDASELAPLSEEERAEFIRDFRKRTESKAPSPSSRIDFRCVDFGCPISFSSFVFPSPARFQRAKFAYNVNFSEAAFLGYVSFIKATFLGYVSFSKAAFFSSAYFKSARFSGHAYFDVEEFRGAASFSGAMFCGDARFNRAKFFEIAVFTACEFKSRISFAGAKFESRVPTFFDTKLREAIVLGQWEGSAPLKDKDWPAPPKDNKDAQLQVVAYERLKAGMERLNRHAEAQFFFIKELRAQRECESRYSPRRALNFAYQILSGYGQSVRLPVFWLVMVFVFGASLFALVPVYKGIPLAYDEAAGLSITNLISFLPYKVENDVSTHLSAFAKIIGNLQSLFGFLLLFLLGLALRNRFRMK
jgi:hypothetical protein